MKLPNIGVPKYDRNIVLVIWYYRNMKSAILYRYFRVHIVVCRNNILYCRVLLLCVLVYISFF